MTLVGSSDVRRLTSDLGRRCQADVVARRAPDRVRSATTRRFHHSPGLAARRCGETIGRLQRRRFTGLVTGWSVAGGRELRTAELRLLALFPRPGGKGPRGIYLVSVEGGDARPLIVSTSNRVDSKPAFSPDGRRLAYVVLRLFRRGHGRDAGLRCGCGRTRYVARHCAAAPPPDDAAVPVHLLPGMDAGRQRHHLRMPPGRPRYSGFWRVTIDGDHAPERIEAAGDLATAPAVARSRDRLAFTRMSLDDDIYRFEAGGRCAAGGRVQLCGYRCHAFA